MCQLNNLNIYECSKLLPLNMEYLLQLCLMASWQGIVDNNINTYYYFKLFNIAFHTIFNKRFLLIQSDKDI